MDMCRICLSRKGNKDICNLQPEESGGNLSFVDVMLFCLDIQVSENSTIAKKLCSKCYKKILSFHKFKSLALKNDAYLKSLDSDLLDNCENKFNYEVNEIKQENSLEYSHQIVYNVETEGEVVNVVKLDMKQEWQPQDEDGLSDLASDDEILSVIKKVKNEKLKEELKENAPYKKKKGRPRKNISEEAPKNVKPEKEVCQECGKKVRNLKEHSMRHLPISVRKQIKCKGCDKVFSSFSARYKHFKIKHLGIKQHCDICDKDVVNVKQHNRVVHNSETLPFGCVPCGRRFISQSALDTHMTAHTKARPHECDICKNKYRSKVALTQHIRQVHAKEKTHLCQFCSKSFFKKYHLQVHVRSHTKERPYKCPDCGKGYSSSTTLKSHRVLHGTVKKYECSQCDMMFMKLSYLRNHMVSHTRERAFACKYCGVGFGRSDHRKRHEYTAHERLFTV